jgi:imidazolonepropionase-like amidohydrolase
VHRAGITIAMGTDAGNPLTLHGPSVYWEMTSMQQAGMSPMDVLVAATRNGARTMGRGDQTGTLEPGKLADLVVLAADPTADIANVQQVRYVMRGGALSIPALLRPR